MSVHLTAEPRSGLGKQKNKQMRKAGRLPAVLYGHGLSDSLAVSLDQKSAEHLIKTNGKSATYELSVDGKVYTARLKEIQYEPLRKGLVHVDFFVAGEGA